MSVEASQRTLKIGDTGNDVQLVQRYMNSLSFGPLIEDGIFGSATQAAVMNYQSSRKLTADGIVGSETWERLSGEGC